MISIGQRWLNHNDSELGLGIVQDTSGRRVEVYFPNIDESRHYAVDNAPLTRYRAQIGETVVTIDELSLSVIEVFDDDGILFYKGDDAEGKTHTISEIKLSGRLNLNSPAERLVNGQVEHPNAYELRYRTLQHQANLAESVVRGLHGARIDLLPHQLYIAHEVASRRAPRVLLADEVGLGKTIEAGMIIHQQLHTGRASRVLILVPDSLVHQWLVEMLRRFNLHFALFDSERCEQFAQQVDEQGQSVNPFETEQQIICSLDALVDNPQMQLFAESAEWDLLIVDEAHHLHWSEKVVGIDYQIVEAISQKAEGLLLLTATPQQAGIESHFARLRLLDPHRFSSLADFQKEHTTNTIDSSVIDIIHSDGDVSKLELENYIDAHWLSSYADPLSDDNKQHLLNRLVDQHGMGRILFRNTRQALDEFPQRVLHKTTLSIPTEYAELIANADDEVVYPELAAAGPTLDDWLNIDPRVTWLNELQQQLRDEKLLVIAHNQTTALQLYNYFKNKLGVSCTCFHEGMSLIERDRSAAYFSDMREGARILFCSEIGSEGRNFQFAHHLVMFDLPDNPDLVEQRIGRLDRIGQTGDVNIHVPYIEGTAQAVLFELYNKGLSLFESSFSSAYSIFEANFDEIKNLLKKPDTSIDAVVRKLQTESNAIRLELEKGRDRLLELNSCRQPMADQLVDKLSDTSSIDTLSKYFESLLDEFGVDHEKHSSMSWVVHPSDHMRHHYFPGLREEGNTVTLDRYKALVREDIEYLSWEHPMVAETMELLLKEHIGSATLVTIKVKGLQPGTLLLEGVFQLQASAPKYLQVERYLSKRPIRILLDKTGKDLSNVVSFDALCKMSQPIKTHLSRQIITEIRNDIEPMVEQCKSVASNAKAELLQGAQQRVNELLYTELERITELEKVNKNIRPEEKKLLDAEIKAVENCLAHADLVLQGIKLVVVS